jgi:hypothetical protein
MLKNIKIISSEVKKKLDIIQNDLCITNANYYVLSFLFTNNNIFVNLCYRYGLDTDKSKIDEINQKFKKNKIRLPLWDMRLKEFEEAVVFDLD